MFEERRDRVVVYAVRSSARYRIVLPWMHWKVRRETLYSVRAVMGEPVSSVEDGGDVLIFLHSHQFPSSIVLNVRQL